ncbi:integrin alpha-9-like protein [Leptotrombidium deliense]|uniref:Integrin alpha-9-like protein n=1 Tax=Leptotrombidium deliense TaxID=299467 RepID=A0A443SIE3_9ACAR|nr:integrin alpha-9-like protein [Leptotrombidium deliense]
MSLGFSTASDGNENVVCAPHWTNSKYTRENNPSGLCYFFTKDYRFRYELAALITPIAIGNFYSKTKQHIAAGVPRSSFIGCVHIVNPNDKKLPFTNQEGIKVYTYDSTKNSICGDQFGEYFGASVLAVDINNDKYSDLIVGAPFYSPSSKGRGDSGRIFVYMSRGNEGKRFLDAPQIITIEKNYGAQFGAAISEIGDLNYDGFNDIVVGAPYENEGTGAIYIYHGKSNGLVGKFSQRISASDHLSFINLKGFGSSLTKGKDVDNNSYPDLLVGSYLTENAVLLRSQPVATLKIMLQFTDVKTQRKTMIINLKNKQCTLGTENYACFNVTTCVQISGHYLPQFQEIEATFDIDTNLKRRAFARLDENVANNSYQFEKIGAILTNNTFQCIAPVTIYLNQNIEDKLTPLQVSVTANIMKRNSLNTFCKHCPVMSKAALEVASAVKKIDFEIGCGEDNKCNADINLLIRSTYPFIVQGRDNELPLFVTISNKGENAYSTKLKLKISPILEIKQISSRCNTEVKDELLVIRCDIENPLETDKYKDVPFLFGTNRLPSSTRNIFVHGKVYTSSDLMKPGIPKQNFTVDVKRFASVILHPEPTPPVLYDAQPKEGKNEFVQFSNRIHVMKENYSSVEEIDIELRIPASYKSDVITYAPTINLISKDCLTTECQEIKCKIGPFGLDTQVAIIELESAINLKAIQEVFSTNKSGYLLLTEADAVIADINIDSPKEVAKAMIPTIFKQNPTQEKISTWIIFTSSGIGLLLFLIIIILLLKIGFFHRKRHEEMKKLLRDNAAKRVSRYDVDNNTNVTDLD